MLVARYLTIERSDFGEPVLKLMSNGELISKGSEESLEDRRLYK